MRVLPGTAGWAQPARDEGMHDNGVVNADIGDGATDFFYPASIFVAEDVAEVGVLDRGPQAFDNVEVCTTETGCADFDDDIPRPCDLWIVDFIKERHFLVFVNSYGFHCTLQFSASALTRGTCKRGSGPYSSQ